jgi:hypothetical protein
MKRKEKETERKRERKISAPLILGQARMTKVRSRVLRADTNPISGYSTITNPLASTSWRANIAGREK